jgi:hypothetical protein
VALRSGEKVPAARAWTDRARRDPPEDAVETPDPAALNTGLLCDGLRVLDLDIDDADAAQHVRAHAFMRLGETLLRTRRGTARCALVYRAAAGSPGKVTLAGARGKIEVLGHGQQLHAFGPHPSGAAITWAAESPETHPCDRLPAVEERTLQHFLAEAGRFIDAEAPRMLPPSPPPLAAPAVPPLDLCAALAVIPNQGPADWEHWNAVGMACWAASGGSDAGEAAWRAWSAQHPRHDAAVLGARWRHFFTSPPTLTGAAKLFGLARAACAEFRRPSELRAAQATEMAGFAPGLAPGLAPALATGLAPVSHGVLSAMPLPPRVMALAPVLPIPGLAMLYAPRGMGKTYAALSIAYAIASGGVALRWSAPAARRVLYIDGEMPAGALQQRIGQIVRGMAAPLASDEHVRFIASDLLPEGLPSIARPETQALIDRALGEAEVLVFDNISTLTGGMRENEGDDWEILQRWLLSLRRRGLGALLIHHAGKRGQQRGTSRREDVLDTVIALRRPEDYVATQGARFEVHLEKARGVFGDDAEPFEAALEATEDDGLVWRTGPLEAEPVTELPEGWQAAISLLRQGRTVCDVAAATGLSKSAVNRARQRAAR